MMKRINIIKIAAVLSIILLGGCMQKESEVILPEHNITLEAKIETFSDVDTKTTLGESSEGHRDILWLPNDSIGVVSGSSISKFINANESAGASANFSGRISDITSFYAVYPYAKTLKFENNAFLINLPSTQKYNSANFTSDMFPMVAKGTTPELEFKNLCGILVLNLKGAGTLKTLKFTGFNENGAPIKVSGAAKVDMTYTGTPALAMEETAKSSVTLDCGDGVALNETTVTPFYIILPPGTYYHFTVTMKMADGKIMNKNATRPLTIVRCNRTPTADLTYSEDILVDLSATGTANSYIVPAAGRYSITATTIGNGASGIIAGASFHTDNATIAPLSAKLLWEDEEGLVDNITLSEGKITFNASALKGNALIAVYDNADPAASDAKILWSWHIWCTDTPQIEHYVNHVLRKYDMQDRNLGAYSPEVGGLFYQWGRKDPFRNTFEKVAVSSTTGTINYVLQHPDIFIYASSSPYNWLSGGINNYLWGNPTGYNYTSILFKTIYDPCPQGYMVPVIDTWSRFTLSGSSASTSSSYNVDGTFSKGWRFYYEKDKEGGKSWYPSDYYISYSSGVSSSGSSGYWSSSPSSESGHPNNLFISSSGINPFDIDYRAYGYHVRCMKEISSLPGRGATISTNSVSSLTISSAVSGGNITDQGVSEVTARGICWSEEQYPAINLETKTSGGTGTGTFTSNITNLKEGTTYYVRSYATNSLGTVYGGQRSFTTLSRPTVFTQSVTYESGTTAAAVGNISAQGSSAVTARGFCWGLSENPTISDHVVTSGSGTGLFSATLTDLYPASTIYVRAYATNAAGTNYGEQKTITTASGVPALSTASISEYTGTTAKSGGTIIAAGGSDITAKGVCWSTSPNPTISDSKTSDGTGTAAFVSSITGLTDGTTYYVRAYATNTSGTGYGEQVRTDRESFIVNGVSFGMIRVSGGTFTMGATSEQGSDAYGNESPTHQVTLSTYLIGEFEVTQKLWRAVTGYSPTSGGSQWSSGYGLGDDYPAYYVSWNDIQAFITQLNTLTGKTFALPTEAQWEYAARGGKESNGYKYSGSNTIGDVAWYSDNSSSTTHEVGTKTPNELGIYDMSGNVWEWCSDWYGSYSSEPQTDPTGPATGSHRVIRGGSWDFTASDCRVSNRSSDNPGSRRIGSGFRLALSLLP